jgi:hypothetical protein
MGGRRFTPDLVVVRDFDILRSSCRPAEADPELFVHSNAVLADPIPSQDLQPVPWWHAKIVEPSCDLQLAQLPSCDPLDVDELRHASPTSKGLRQRTAKRSDQAPDSNVTRYDRQSAASRASIAPRSTNSKGRRAAWGHVARVGAISSLVVRSTCSWPAWPVSRRPEPSVGTTQAVRLRRPLARCRHREAVGQFRVRDEQGREREQGLREYPGLARDQPTIRLTGISSACPGCVARALVGRSRSGSRAVPADRSVYPSSCRCRSRRTRAQRPAERRRRPPLR